MKRRIDLNARNYEWLIPDFPTKLFISNFHYYNMEHDNTYEIDIFSDKSFKLHSAKGSETFDNTWYIGVRGNLHVTKETVAFGSSEIVQIIPYMTNDIMSCFINNDRKMVICNVKKRKGD